MARRTVSLVLGDRVLVRVELAPVEEGEVGRDDLRDWIDEP